MHISFPRPFDLLKVGSPNISFRLYLIRIKTESNVAFGCLGDKKTWVKAGRHLMDGSLSKGSSWTQKPLQMFSWCDLLRLNNWVHDFSACFRNHIQWCEKVFTPIQTYSVFTLWSHLKVLDHQTDFNIRYR